MFFAAVCQAERTTDGRVQWRAPTHATLQDVNGALNRARAFMQARRTAADGAELMHR